MRHLTMILGFVILGACAGIGGPGGGGDIEGDASEPVITWDSTLMAQVVIMAVNEDGSSGGIWQITADECEDVIGSPLTVGVVPEGTTELGPAPLPLVPGLYEASMYRCIDHGYGDGPEISPVGDLPFTVHDDDSITIGHDE